MTIYLIDDHALVADSVADFLRKQPGVKAVQTFNKAKVFLEKYNSQQGQPHIVITDIVMPDMDGLTFLKEFQKINRAGAKVMVLSSVYDMQTVKQAIRSGASGYVSKLTPAEDLVAAIQEVTGGSLYISDHIKDTFVSNVLFEEKVAYHLSTREKEVLDMVCSGLTIKEIASKMNLSKHTVQSYHRLVMKKMKVNRTADLVIMAVQMGLYTPDINKQW